jgi:hypothetical protein
VAAGAVLLAAVLLLIRGCEERPEPDADRADAPLEAGQPAPDREASEPDGPGRDGPGGAGAREREGLDPAGPPAGEEAARAPASRAAIRTYRDYLAAINRRDGGRLCELLAPGSLRELDPPRGRGGCAATIRSSIGYEDPRGYPVWAETVLSGIESVAVDPSLDQARVTAAVVTRFADRTQPSVESDIAYLERRADGWRLAKPSGVLYRAVGKPEFPPEVLSPP